MSTLLVFLGLIAAWFAARFAYEWYRFGHLGYHYESWKDPTLTFAVTARSPLWLVCKEDPETLKPRPGMAGPYFFHVAGVRVGAYVRDRDRIDEALDSVRDEVRRLRATERIEF